MNESQARLGDALCRIVATIALVVGGGWTLGMGDGLGHNLIKILHCFG